MSNQTNDIINNYTIPQQVVNHIQHEQIIHESSNDMNNSQKLDRDLINQKSDLNDNQNTKKNTQKLNNYVLTNETDHQHNHTDVPNKIKDNIMDNNNNVEIRSKDHTNNNKVNYDRRRSTLKLIQRVNSNINLREKSTIANKTLQSKTGNVLNMKNTTKAKQNTMVNNDNADDNKAKKKKKNEIKKERLDNKIIRKMKIRRIKKGKQPVELKNINYEYEQNAYMPQEDRFKYIKIIRLTGIEYASRFKDRFPLLKFRRLVYTLLKLFSAICYKIIKSSWFEFITLMIILWNTIMLAFYDPVTGITSYPSYIDNIFLGYYTAEMFLKICGLGFLFVKNAYLRDPWNILDFIIVITSYLPLLIGKGGGINFTSIKSLRMLRPLRTISTIKSLRLIVSTILQSLPYLKDIIFVAFFTFYLYAVIGLHLFKGATKNRCMDVNTGLPIYNSNYPEINYQQYCGAWPCSPNLGLDGMNLVCAKMIAEPYYGTTSFGTILWSLLNVYQVITQEGWSGTMIILQLTCDPWSAIYFISLTFVGACYFMNVIMAIISATFEANSNKQQDNIENMPKVITQEQIVITLLNQNKYKIIQIINKYYEGQLNYNKIQFIDGQLYIYNPKNEINYKSMASTLTMDYLNHIDGKINTNGSKRSSMQRISTYFKIVHAKIGDLFTSWSSENNKNKVTPLVKSNISSENNLLITNSALATYSNIEFSAEKTKKSTLGKSFRGFDITEVEMDNTIAENIEKMKQTSDSKMNQTEISIFERGDMQANQKKNEKEKEKKSEKDNDSNILENEVLNHTFGDQLQNEKVILKPKSKNSNLLPRYAKKTGDKNIGIANGDAIPSLDLNEDQEYLNQNDKYSDHKLIRKIEDKTPKPKRKKGIPFQSGFDKDNKRRKDKRESKLDILSRYNHKDSSIFMNDYNNEIMNNNDDSAIGQNTMSFISEYTEDVSKLEIGKDRFIVDIKDLKIGVNNDEVIASIDLLKDIIPTYHQKHEKKQENKEIKSYLKANLRTSYNITNKKKSNSNKLHQKRMVIFDLPIYKKAYSSKIYDKELRLISGFKKMLPHKNNHSKTSSMDQMTLMKKMLSTKYNLLKLRDYYGIQAFKSYEPDIDMIYGSIKEKLNEDLEIDKLGIIFSERNEYFKFDKEYTAIKQIDIKTKNIGTRNWSAHEILSNSYYQLGINKIKKALMQKYESIWESGYWGLFQAFRRIIKKFYTSQVLSITMLLIVIANTILIAGIGIIPTDNESSTNIAIIDKIFTGIFIIEMGIFIFGLGPIEYLKDATNIINALIVLTSIIELILEESSQASKTLKSIRFLRAVRVLRLGQFLTTLKFMRFLIDILAKTFRHFMSVLFLIIILMFIYALIGMQLLGGNFDYPDNIGWNAQRNNYDTLSEALISTYQVMTMENWNNILVLAERSSAGYYLPLLYLISWIVIGNYILLNLLMAMLLSQFGGDEAEEYQQELKELNENKSDKEKDHLDTKDTINLPTLHFILRNPKLCSIPVQNNILEKIPELQANQIPPEINPNLELKEENKSVLHDHIELYEDIKCRKSLYFIDKSWKIRIWLYRLCTHRWFDYFFLLITIVSSLKLVLDTFIDSTMPNTIMISNYINIILVLLFTFESLIKITVYGLVLNKGSYLRNPWNAIDFLIVIFGLIDIITSSSSLQSLAVCIFVEALRPLRLLIWNKGIRLMIIALFKSFNGILNATVVILQIMLIFGIFGLSLFQNRLGVCNVSGNPNLSRYGINYETCQLMGYNWMVWNINWDNIFNGMLSLFVAITQEGWPDYMFQCIDGASTSRGPIKDLNVWIFLYYAGFILVAANFLMNLFVGVIMFQYGQAEKEQKKKYLCLTENQEKWIDIQRMLVKVQPYIKIHPKYLYQKILLKTVDNNIFEAVILLCILANMAIVCLDSDDLSPSFQATISVINYVFTSIFIFEMILKILAYGSKIYFVDKWNRLEASAVLANIIEIIIDMFNYKSLKYFKFYPKLARLLRIFKVTRLFRNNQQFLNIQKLIYTILYSIPYVGNALALVTMVFFVYSLWATVLFSQIISGQQIGLYLNFLNFSNSINTLFICSTGENWYIIMFDTINSGVCVDGTNDCLPNSAISLIFWISFTVIVKYITLSLFIMIIVDCFSDVLMNEENPLNHFQENVIHFKKVWATFATTNYGLCIHQNQIVSLFVHLDEPLGFRSGDITKTHSLTTKEIAKKIMQMNIRVDDDKKISFHEAIFAAFKNAYGDFDKDSASSKAYELINNIEILITMQFLFINDHLTYSIYQKLSFNKVSASRIRAVKNLNKLANPLFQLLYIGMSLKAWKNYAIIINEANAGNPLLIKSCSESEEDNTSNKTNTDMKPKELIYNQRYHTIIEDNEVNNTDRFSDMFQCQITNNLVLEDIKI